MDALRRTSLPATVLLALLAAAFLPRPAFPEGLTGCGALDPEVSIAACTAIIDAEKSPQSDTHARAMAFYRRANDHAALKQEAAAVADYTEAIRLEPDFAGAYNNRGNVYAALGQHQHAVDDFTHALRLKPNYVTALFNRSASHVVLGRPDAAVDDLTSALEFVPNSPMFLFRRGMVYVLMHDVVRAQADLSRILEIDPGHRGARTALDRLTAGPAD